MYTCLHTQKHTHSLALLHLSQTDLPTQADYINELRHWCLMMWNGEMYNVTL